MNKFLLFLLILFSLQVKAQQLAVTELTCEFTSAPIGLEELHPRLSWLLTSNQRNVKQVAYRILVADNLANLSKNLGNVWDTKKVNSSQSILIPYAGKGLEAVKTYYWKVMVWDNQKNVTIWSKPNTWQMGLLNKTDWKGAQWIGYEKLADSLKVLPGQGQKPTAKGDVLPLLRKEFVVAKKIKKATAFVAGLGHFDLRLNGKKVGNHFLDAGWTQYEKTALYVAFDITNQLKPGNNAIGVMLGNGFYFIPRDERYRKLELSYGFPKMICRVVIDYTDGTSQNIISNDQWKTTGGPITFSSIYGGEDYNANLEMLGWDTAPYNDKDWKKPVIVDGPPSLIAQTAPPIKVFLTFSPVSILEVKPGVWVYDLGQNASAIPKITFKGLKNAKVRIKPSELLKSDGSITTEPIGTPVYFDYTLKGGVAETWQPQFMYYGFRYVQIEGAVPAGKPNPKKLPEISNLQSLHTRNASAEIGTFNCSSQLFNRTYNLIDWSIRSNMASVFTDCPHREKLGWLEEAHLVGASARYTYDIAGLSNKTVNDMMDAQTENGLVTSIAPEYDKFGGPFRDSPEWGSNSIIMPWYLYEWYGDERVLSKAYPMMQSYLSYLQTKEKDGIVTHGLGDWYDIGPKPPGVSQLTPLGLTATSIYYYDLMIMVKIAKLLNKPQDQAAYQAKAEKLKLAFNKKYFKEDCKQYATGSQTSNAMAMYMGLVDPVNQPAILEQIVKDIQDKKNSLTTGDIGYRYLLRVLAANGRSDVIFDMNSNSKVPGYGYQLDRGATALTESWQGANNASNNHMMLGHLTEWFYSDLAGIKSVDNAVAFKELIIDPQVVGDVSYAKATHLSPYGLIVSSWKKEGKIFTLNVEVPVNTTATICLPGSQQLRITESGKAISAAMKSAVKYNKDKIMIKVGSGTYNFSVQ